MVLFFRFEKNEIVLWGFSAHGLHVVFRPDFSQAKQHAFFGADFTIVGFVEDKKEKKKV
jgi:hypothetical protein